MPRMLKLFHQFVAVRLVTLGLLPVGFATVAVGAEALDPATAKPGQNGSMLFYDVRSLGVEGQGWTEVASPFDRLPSKAKDAVRPRVWDLSTHSAGLAVRFVTDATAIDVRWTLTSANLAMAHMPATGVSGVDLYVKHDGRWRFLAVGQPNKQEMTATLASDLPPGTRQYMLYLPLYNGVSSVEIGIPPSAALSKGEPRSADASKPIVFYGTSIMQGGCASRPGMALTSILGRRLDRPVINLGFSGNGNMDAEVAALLAELDPAVFVIDCLPNMTPEMVADRSPMLVRTIRESRPTTPILLVEDRTFATAFISPSKLDTHAARRAALRKTFDVCVAAGDKNIVYLHGDELLAADGEDTVDGSHPTDIGFVHYADAFQPVLEKMLGGLRAP
jgi:hypothetical protein